MATLTFEPSGIRDDYARAYLSPMMRAGTREFVANVHARLGVVQGDGFALPIAFDFERGDSYVVSPLSHYVGYGAEELSKLGRPRVEATLRSVLKSVGSGLEASGFDEVVSVNNWLLSTNLWPPLSTSEVRDVLEALVATFPNRPILFRSLDLARNALTFGALSSLGCVPLFSRVVHYQDPRRADFWHVRQLREDERRVRKVPAELVTTFTDDDLARVKVLYDDLYLRKYSTFNPQFTVAFLRNARDEGLLDLRGWRVDGELVAAWGAFVRSGVMTVPVFGYDTAASKKLALYRLSSLEVSRRARERGLLVNASGGVGAFKKARSGVTTVEFNLVFTRHLPWRRRLAWSALGRFLDRVAVPIILHGEY
ncbi:GNAT family N-acetyltransferase [Deinococcus yavapaiensis]|uniref:Acetyltransferase (GNAT) family protein n=1 Tax=Deinococcus yavapaiensis KR-236 TaxID=694435 RepID=A0A318SC19_9DEIO|nr:GNAT family N-acetyltransferase [Deinococcus yavapaiensis]PYE56558.1 acetyltransferase (GNAT) family protein [Deinococcus yavapaiensis KR-236]